MNPSRSGSPRSFTVVSEMNRHGALTVRSSGTHATFHLVDFADDATREKLASLVAGESVRLDLSRVGRRGNVWRADAVTPRLAVDAADAESAAGS